MNPGRWKLLRLALQLIIAAALMLTLMTFLPHDKFLRYRALNDGHTSTAHWIYQRIHDDSTPIDIAFIGTSRIGMAIHSRRLQDDLAQLGVSAKVVNLFVVKNGRNIHYAIAKELLTHRKVKLLVLEITATEDRRPHPDFIYLADVRDVLLAPVIINVGYLSDLARLPGRQLGLFIDTRLSRYDLEHLPYPSYEGSNLDQAEYVQALDGTRRYRNHTHSAQEMALLGKQQAQEMTREILPQSWSWLEYRLPRYYVDQILKLAAAHNIRVAFLYLPGFGDPARSEPYDRLYQQRAPLINPWPVMQDYQFWEDAVHVNWTAAQRITDYVASSLVKDGLYTDSKKSTPEQVDYSH